MLAHIILAVLIQLPVARLCRSWMAGAVAASAWSLSREITQAEYRWIERFGDGLRANMPWWGGLDMKVWVKIDPWLDWIVPTIVVFAIALIAQWEQRTRRGDHRSKPSRFTRMPISNEENGGRGKTRFADRLRSDSTNRPL